MKLACHSLRCTVVKVSFNYFIFGLFISVLDNALDKRKIKKRKYPLHLVRTYHCFVSINIKMYPFKPQWNTECGLESCNELWKHMALAAPKLCTPMESCNIQLSKRCFESYVALTIQILHGFVWDLLELFKYVFQFLWLPTVKSLV